jgi:hypothetical protein
MKSILSIALAAALAQVSMLSPPPKVSADVKATFDGWGVSKESALYPVAVIKFTNPGKKTCAVKRYALHWSEGSFEGKPADLKLAPGETATREVKLERHAAPADKVAVVQVWETDCK